jgi:hypothetical protein
MSMKYNYVFILLVIMVGITSSIYIVREVGIGSYNEVVNNISIEAVYDPYNDFGVVTYNMVFNEELNNTLLLIPLTIGDVVEIINVTNSEGLSFIYTFISDNNTLEVLVNNTDNLIVSYEATNILDEVGIGAFSGVIDLSPYQNISSITMKLYIPGTFTVEAQPEAMINIGNNVTEIIFNEPTIYTLYLVKSLPTPTTTASTTSTTTPSIPTTTTTSSTTTIITTKTTTTTLTATQTTTITTTSTIVSPTTTTTTTITTSTTTVSPTTSLPTTTLPTKSPMGGVSNTYLYVGIGVVIVITIVLIVLFARRK